MPTWLLRILPYVGFALALGLAVWYIDHRGYERAQAEAERDKLEESLTRAEAEQLLAQQIRVWEEKLDEKLAESDARLAQRIGQIETVNRTIIQPTLEREIRSETRFSDPALGITDGMLRVLNQARALSGGSCPAGTDPATCSSLPASEPADGQLNRDTGN